MILICMFKGSFSLDADQFDLYLLTKVHVHVFWSKSLTCKKCLTCYFFHLCICMVLSSSSLKQKIRFHSRSRKLMQALVDYPRLFVQMDINFL